MQLRGPNSALSGIADRLGLAASRVALAWIPKWSKVMLTIPGTQRATRLVRNVAAAAVQLSEANFSELDRQG
jgi:pyridoxine 4-dehydrogenase